MSLKLFYTPISPPARAVLLTVRCLDLEVEVKTLNLLTGEHHAEDFLRLNPRHQVPVLVDDGFVVIESRAIMGYLVNSKKPGSDWYPNDPKKRAVIDQRLYYDATVVFERNGDVIVGETLPVRNSTLIKLFLQRPAYSQSSPSISKTQKDLIDESMQTLNGFLKGNSWFAGDKPTIADLSILPNVSQIKSCGFDISKFGDLSKWFERCKSLKGFEENQRGAEEVGEYFKSKIPNAFESN